MEEEVVILANEIWSELVASSAVESLRGMKPFYNECVLHEDKTQFKHPTEMSVTEYKEISPRHLWNANVKFSFFSICLDNTIVICLCHLLTLTAYKLKVLGEDAFGKVTTRCSVPANITNIFLNKTESFFLLLLAINVYLLG